MTIRVWATPSCLVLTSMLFIGTANVSKAASFQNAAPAADNTRANKDHDLTADQQKENTNDREITRQIRKAVVADKSLSSYAHNVKIITSNGVVTLRGPVRTEEERASVEAKAKAIAGVTNVTNEITVVPKKT